MTGNIDRFGSVNPNVGPNQEKPSDKIQSFFKTPPKEVHREANKDISVEEARLTSNNEEQSYTEELISAAQNKKACELARSIAGIFKKT